MSYLTDLPISSSTLSSTSNVSSGLQMFIDYINILEGIKTRIKNMHWAAKRLPNLNKVNAHLYLDDLLGIVSDFQDTIAESSQGIYGSMELQAISGVSFTATSTSDLMNYIRDNTMEFYSKLANNSVYSGIRSETEVFIKDIQKYKYLFNLTD